MRRWSCGRLAGLGLALTLLLATRPTLAQELSNTTLVLVDRVGFADDELFELQYGLEQIVTDFGELALLTSLDRDGVLTPMERDRLPTCGLDVACFADILRPLGLDSAVVVETEAGDEGYVAYTLGLDLHAAQILAEHQGNFPDPGDSLYLLAPMFETMEPLVGLSASGQARSPRDEPRDERREDERFVPPPLDDEGEMNVLATALIAGGGVVTLTGIVFWMLADDTLEDIQSEPHERAALSDLQDTGDGQQTLGNLLFFGGLAVVATGIVFELAGIGEPSGDNFSFDDEWGRLEVVPGPDPYVGIEVSF